MTGSAIITELIQELKISVEASKEFEGDMARLSDYAKCVSGGILWRIPGHRCMAHRVTVLFGVPPADHVTCLRAGRVL